MTIDTTHSAHSIQQGPWRNVLNGCSPPYTQELPPGCLRRKPGVRTDQGHSDLCAQSHRPAAPRPSRLHKPVLKARTSTAFTALQIILKAAGFCKEPGRKPPIRSVLSCAHGQLLGHAMPSQAVAPDSAPCAITCADCPGPWLETKPSGSQDSAHVGHRTCH